MATPTTSKMTGREHQRQLQRKQEQEHGQEQEQEHEYGGLRLTRRYLLLAAPAAALTLSRGERAGKEQKKSPQDIIWIGHI